MTVRDELIGVLYLAGVQQNMTAADAILERFDVTPKPVISDEDLGRIVDRAASHCEGPAEGGKNLRFYLEQRGMEIVRKEAGE